MTNQMKNVPELRFPEFDGEWEEGTIKSLVHGNLSDGDWINKEYLLPNGKYRIIQTGNISVGKYLNKEKSSKFISQSSYDELKANEVFPGDILISRLADPAGRSIIMPNINWKMVTSVDVAIIRPNKKFESYFLISILNTDKKLYDISKLVSGTSHKRISRKNLEKVKIIYPKIQEQQKIGDFFSKLDRQIELEEQKLAKLEEQKKGYMQKLFSQELRFKTKDNVYYSEWQLHKLGEIFKYSQGQQISVDKQFSVKSNEMKRFIRIVDITENPEPRFVLYESDTGLVNKEDLFMIRYGRPGIVSIGFEGIIANNLFKLIPKIKISTVYFYYLLSYNYYRINLLTNQSTMPALNFKSLDLLKFKIPSYKEQNKIGNFFTKFDELIEKQNKKIDGLKERKKGFLQKMFV